MIAQSLPRTLRLFPESLWEVIHSVPSTPFLSSSFWNIYQAKICFPPTDPAPTAPEPPRKCPVFLHQVHHWVLWGCPHLPSVFSPPAPWVFPHITCKHIEPVIVPHVPFAQYLLQSRCSINIGWTDAAVPLLQELPLTLQRECVVFDWEFSSSWFWPCMWMGAHLIHKYVLVVKWKVEQSLPEGHKMRVFLKVWEVCLKYRCLTWLTD